PNGMFFWGYADEKCQDLLAKSGVVWTPGERLGATNDHVRINLGQSCTSIQKAVKEILKNDRK
ncbi:hypothetical protein, partial [Escherichia coli]|uniref:hypothetical protein n=1 Tax=Escherichia coli TaxID=562 RepID=UPI001F1D5840